MAEVSAFDFSATLIPIANCDHGAGSNPRADSRFDSSFEKFRGAYMQAREAERAIDIARVKGESIQSPTTKLWETVLNLGTLVLVDVGKDLEVAARMTEALARLYGAAGIRDGLLMTSQLADQFWDDLYPPLDPLEGAEERTAILSGLNGANKPGVLVERVNFLPITKGSNDRDFCLWEYSIAVEAQRISDEQARKDRHSQIGYALEDIVRTANETPAEYFAQLKDEVDGAISALSEFDRVFDRYSGSLAPPTSQIRNSLENAANAIQRLGQQKINSLVVIKETTQQIEPVNAPNGAVMGTPIEAYTISPLSMAQLQSRDDAILAMELVASYFRTTEPHSPISYTLAKLVKWANMPLDKLILEWIPDSSARDLFGLMTGVVSRDSED